MQSTCGGTQALRIFADLALQEATTQQYTPTVLVAAPTWGNHLLIFKQFQQIKFNHLDESGFASYQNYLDTITSAPDNAVLLMHGGATHNPSGQNLSSQEIVALADIVNAKNIKVLIDSAYFGFGASLEDEAVLLSTLMNSFNNCAIAFSYSKNGSLYEHRTGALFIKTENKAALESQLQQMARESVSMAPGLGQDIMFDVLSNHFAEWELEVDTIREALAYKRDSLVDALGSKYEYLKGTRGMFGLLPFTPDIINELKQTYSVYMSSNGRINFAGINPTNFEYLVSAIKKSTS
jgi:aspartate/tyrosine/aromatic aminotransferase